ncbi:MAG: hypothetical protein FVQ82_13515 [Planctomycetes bacterium]|nr:hypothetical protein [Planctomycetota bacterium]
MSKLYRASIVLGALPLIVGSLVFVFWYFSMMRIFEVIGVFTVLGGLVSVAIGTICLVKFLFQQIDENAPSKILRGKGLLSGGLLASNFLLVVIIFFAVLYLYSTNILTIRNDSSSVISNVTITAPGVQLNTGAIKPGKKKSRRIRHKGDGALQFTAIQNDIEYSGVIEGYVIAGDKYILTVNDVNDFKVRKL